MVTVRGEPALVPVGLDTLGTAPQQGHGAAGVAPVGVGQPDRDLG